MVKVMPPWGLIADTGGLLGSEVNFESAEFFGDGVLLVMAKPR